MTMPITIDLISDTTTKPTEGMRDAMARAEVGDEQRGEDPSVNALCERVAAVLGMQAAIFLPSGIMSNLIAILVHCRPGDEVIAAGNAHIISSEGAGASELAGAMITTIDTLDGRFMADQFATHIRAPRPRAPRTRLVSIEQTSNKGGGTVWSVTAMRDISAAAAERGIKVHMDGARLFNAAVASSLQPTTYAQHCDSAWIDLSKGLGCPVGSVLAGSREFIDEARIWKHRLGGPCVRLACLLLRNSMRWIIMSTDLPMTTTMRAAWPMNSPRSRGFDSSASMSRQISSLSMSQIPAKVRPRLPPCCWERHPRWRRSESCSARRHAPRHNHPGYRSRRCGSH
jgi:hypothetical protein